MRDLNTSLFSLRGTWEIDEGMLDEVATEVRTAREAAACTIRISSPGPSATS